MIPALALIMAAGRVCRNAVRLLLVRIDSAAVKMIVHMQVFEKEQTRIAKRGAFRTTLGYFQLIPIFYCGGTVPFSAGAGIWVRGSDASNAPVFLLHEVNRPDILRSGPF